MTDFIEPLIDLLDALVPSGALHATEWYTFNEIIAMLFFYSIVWNWFLYPIVMIPRIFIKSKNKGVSI